MSSPARLATRIWGSFALSPAVPDAPDGACTDRYLVDEVAMVKGAAIPHLARGWHMARTDAPVPPADPAPAGPGGVILTGTTQHLQYTDGGQQGDLGRISNSGKDHGPGTLAVLIPISKSEAWWALPLEARQEHFRTGARLASPPGVGPGHGHTTIGAAYADRIFRRLYHARYLPGSGWDFLTYFEMRPEHAPAFRQLLAQLRDPERNPEWAYVEREVEIWTTRL